MGKIIKEYKFSVGPTDFYTVAKEKIEQLEDHVYQQGEQIKNLTKKIKDLTQIVIKEK